MGTAAELIKDAGDVVILLGRAYRAGRARDAGRRRPAGRDCIAGAWPASPVRPDRGAGRHQRAASARPAWPRHWRRA
ncbi:MAG: hypothetical protein WKF40_05735 [Thermoleophilaceae bacterium]